MVLLFGKLGVLPAISLLFCALYVLGVDGRDKYVRNVHLAFSGQPHNIYTVTFDSDYKHASARVMWGASPSSLKSTSDSCTTQFYDRACGYIYHCAVSEFPRGSSVYYKVGFQEGDRWSSTFNIRSTFDASTSTQPLRIWVDADVGLTGAEATIEAWRKLSSDVALALHMGDISYANDHPQEYETWYSRWFDAMSPGIASVPYMVSVGNHESWCRWPTCAIQTRNFTTYKERYSMPGAFSGSNTNMWYSFDVGLAHIISFSSETDYPGHPHDLTVGGHHNSDVLTDQLTWLRQDLSSVDRSVTPWVIVMAHRPWYINDPKANTKQGYPADKNRAAELKAFEPMFLEYGVDLFLSGHVHHYERQYPAINGTVLPAKSYTNAKAFASITAGGAGNAEGISKYEHQKDMQPPWFASGWDSSSGYGILTISNKTHMHWSYYRSDEMSQVDTVEIIKE